MVGHLPTSHAVGGVASKLPKIEGFSPRPAGGGGQKKISPVNPSRKDHGRPGHRCGGVGWLPTENARQFSASCVLTEFCRRGEIEVVSIKSAFLSLRSVPCMHVASSSPMTASIPDRCRPIWATATSSTQCATPSWRRPASRTSGTIEGIRARPVGFGLDLRS